MVRDILSCNDLILESDIKSICFGKNAKHGYSLEGLLELLSLISLIQLKQDGYKLNCEDINLQSNVNDDLEFCKIIICRLIQKIHEYGHLNLMFPPGSFEYRTEIGSYLITKSKIPTFYGNLKSFLEDFNFFDNYDIPGLLILNEAFHNVFREEIEKKISIPMEILDIEINKKKTDEHKVLIVVATQLELKSVLTKMRAQNLTPKAFKHGNQVFWKLGNLGGANLILVKITNMGSSGPGGSSLVVNDAIGHINPSSVVMLGIAFGLNKEKQEIGRVLVAKQLEGYELSKIKEDATIQRGDKMPTGTNLVNIFENAEVDFNKANIEFGLLISGEKLVDNKVFVDRLKVGYPEAIGGEMEGEGLRSACHKCSVEWILIKGICDWGFEKNSPNKEEDQLLAINNVCDFFIYSLKTIGYI